MEEMREEVDYKDASHQKSNIMSPSFLRPYFCCKQEWMFSINCLKNASYCLHARPKSPCEQILLVNPICSLHGGGKYRIN